MDTKNYIELPEAKKRRGRLPASVAEMLSKKAGEEAYKAGGFGCACEKCGGKYGQSYLVYVYLGSFKEGYVCRECYKQYHLQKA